MKNFTLSISMLLFFSVAITYGQDGTNMYLDPKYGPDSTSRMNCANNLSTMSEFMKINLFDYALQSWRAVFNECPASSRNIYLYGIRIYREKLDSENNPGRKQTLLDTLMLIYDRRIEYFGQEGLVIGRKGIDLIKYDQQRLEEAYKYLEKSIKLTKINAEDAVVVTYMQLTIALYKNNLLEGQQVIDNYLVASDILDAKIKSGQDDMAETALQNVEALFSESGAASCDDLISIFTPKYKETPTDIEFLKKLTVLLVKRGCEGSNLFAGASENLYKLEPSAEAAYNLAKLFLRREEYEKSAEYYKKTIDLEENNENKALYLYQLALIEYTKFNQFPQARSHALEAINLKPGWGEPYILIGNLYASSSKSCGENEFEQSTVFWAAVDKFTKAKSVDESIAAEANDLISKYSQYFPDGEEAFFHGLQPGQSYSIGCWINETTSVRTR